MAHTTQKCQLFQQLYQVMSPKPLYQTSIALLRKTQVMSSLRYLENIKKRFCLWDSKLYRMRLLIQKSHLVQTKEIRNKNQRLRLITSKLLGIIYV